MRDYNADALKISDPLLYVQKQVDFGIWRDEGVDAILYKKYRNLITMPADVRWFLDLFLDDYESPHPQYPSNCVFGTKKKNQYLN